MWVKIDAEHDSTIILAQKFMKIVEFYLFFIVFSVLYFSSFKMANPLEELRNMTLRDLMEFEVAFRCSCGASALEIMLSSIYGLMLSNNTHLIKLNCWSPVLLLLMFA